MKAGHLDEMNTQFGSPVPIGFGSETAAGTAAGFSTSHSHASSRFAGALLFACMALAVALPIPASAERADRQKPLNVESDKMQYDDIKQINIFTGNVRLTKGTLVITGERIVVRQDPEGFQHGTAYGSPATFRQKREGVDQFVEGCGLQLEYNGKTEVVHFRNQAQLKRFEGERLTDEVYGTLITYESLTEFFTVDGQSGAKPGEIPGRVRVIIQPKAETEPGKSAPVPAGSLKPAAALSGKTAAAQAAKCR